MAGSGCDAAAGWALGKVRGACSRWGLLRTDDETVTFGISGGTDSLVLAELLARLREVTGSPRDLIALHVTADGTGTRQPLDTAVAAFCKRRKIGLCELEPRLDPKDTFPMGCFRCAHIRRRTLLEATDAVGARTLALGHHADDVVETWLMSLLYTGTADVLPPWRSYFGGVVTIVRPLYDLSARDVARVARRCELPATERPCGVEHQSRRNRIRTMLRALEGDERCVRRNLFGLAQRSPELAELGQRPTGHMDAQ